MIVQRKDRNVGPPPYRFKGPVCGHYINPVTGECGVVVMSTAEMGCCQIFPNYMVEEATSEYQFEIEEE